MSATFLRLAAAICNGATKQEPARALARNADSAAFGQNADLHTSQFRMIFPLSVLNVKDLPATCNNLCCNNNCRKVANVVNNTISIRKIALMSKIKFCHFSRTQTHTNTHIDTNRHTMLTRAWVLINLHYSCIIYTFATDKVTLSATCCKLAPFGSKWLQMSMYS